jgi:hypothetical protein
MMRSFAVPMTVASMLTLGIAGCGGSDRSASRTVSPAPTTAPSRVLTIGGPLGHTGSGDELVLDDGCQHAAGRRQAFALVDGPIDDRPACWPRHAVRTRA